MPGKEGSVGRPSHRQRHRKKNLRHRFEVIRTLGEGTYGKVKLAKERETGDFYAIKTIRKKQIGNDQDLARLRREIEIMASLSHPHIISVYEVFENSDKIILVMEYASGGELYDYCNDKRGLYDDEARKFFRQIVSAVHYMHMNGIVHRDLKLENIVLDQNGDVKIADFGFANLHSAKLLSTFCGSPLYASPEIVNGLPYKGPEVDCWSLGVLLYAMVYGAMPFDGTDFRVLRNQITAGNYYRPSSPSDASGLISKLLCTNPEKRARVEDIADHWWTNVDYEFSPVEDTAPGKVVDQTYLIRKLSTASSSSSDCDLVVLDANQSCDDDDIKPSAACSSQSQVSGPETPANSQIKGILKRPKQNSHPAGVGCRKSRSMDSNFKLSCEESSYQVEAASVVRKISETLPTGVHPTTVFDCTKKPKKGILKNGGRPYVGADSGCIMDETALAAVSPSRTNATDSPDISHEDSPNDLSLSADNGYDLTDIEAILDELAADNSTSEDTTSSVSQPDQTQSEDSGISVGSPSIDTSSHDTTTAPEKSSTGQDSNFVTSTPNSGTLKSGRRKKGILKHNSKYSDPTWRHSTGSQSSTSSADLLDFSYDSGEGEPFMSEYFSMPLSSPPLSEPQTAESLLEHMDIELRKFPVCTTEDEVVEAPPLPDSPPPGHPPPHPSSTWPAFHLSYENDEILEKITSICLDSQKLESPCSPRSPHKVDWDEVEDIYRQALALRSEWS